MTSLRLLCILCVLFLAGCVKGHMPIDTDNIDQPDEIQSGPRLFSGEDGAFTFSY